MDASVPHHPAEQARESNPSGPQRPGDPAGPDEPEPPREVDGKAMLISFALTAVFDIGLALAAFNLASRAGLGDPLAYLVSGIGPLSMLVISRLRTRTFGGASVVILVYLLLSAVAAFIGGPDPRLLIVKDSAVTGGLGLACLASLLLPKPLMFYFGAKFATDATREGLSYWYGLWRYPDFRRTQYLINTVWGVGFLVEAALKMAIAYSVTDFDLAYTTTSILPFVFLLGLITFTVATGRRARRAATQRIQAHQATTADPAHPPAEGREGDTAEHEPKGGAPGGRG